MLTVIGSDSSSSVISGPNVAYYRGWVEGGERGYNPVQLEWCGVVVAAANFWS